MAWSPRWRPVDRGFHHQRGLTHQASSTSDQIPFSWHLEKMLNQIRHSLKKSFLSFMKVWKWPILPHMCLNSVNVPWWVPNESFFTRLTFHIAVMMITKQWSISFETNDFQFGIAEPCWDHQFLKTVNRFAYCGSNIDWVANFTDKEFLGRFLSIDSKIFVDEPNVAKRDWRIRRIINKNFELFDLINNICRKWYHWDFQVLYMTFPLSDETFQFNIEEMWWALRLQEAHQQSRACVLLFKELKQNRMNSNLYLEKELKIFFSFWKFYRNSSFNSNSSFRKR